MHRTYHALSWSHAQDRIRQLEHGLLQQLEESQQHALHRAEDAALCTRLQTLLGDGALTDTAVEAMLHSSPVAPSVLLEELSSSSKQVRALIRGV